MLTKHKLLALETLFVMINEKNRLTIETFKCFNIKIKTDFLPYA